jgi:hypothetical protein
MSVNNNIIKVITFPHIGKDNPMLCQYVGVGKDTFARFNMSIFFQCNMETLSQRPILLYSFQGLEKIPSRRIITTPL